MPPTHMLRCVIACCSWLVFPLQSPNMHITMMKGIIGYFCGFMDYEQATERVCCKYPTCVYTRTPRNPFVLATFVSVFGQPTTHRTPHVSFCINGYFLPATATVVHNFCCRCRCGCFCWAKVLFY